jgi:hypothetical protein
VSGPTAPAAGQPHDDALPITVLLPEAATSPIIVFDGGAALRMAIVERGGVSALSQHDWDRPGVYVLLDLPAVNGSWAATPEKPVRCGPDSCNTSPRKITGAGPC